MHLRSVVVAAGILVAGLLILAVIAPLFSMGVDRNPPGVSRTISDWKQISLALWAYKNDFGTYPQGSASDIVKALYGRNPEEKVYLDTHAIKTDESGSPLDAWRHPIEIRFGSDGEPTVSSPGKDGIYKNGWRSDDIKK